MSGPAGALAPGVICLPLVQSLWPVEGTCRTEATPSRAGSCGGGVGCAESRGAQPDRCDRCRTGASAFTSALEQTLDIISSSPVHSESLLRDTPSRPSGHRLWCQCPQGWSSHPSRSSTFCLWVVLAILKFFHLLNPDHRPVASTPGAKSVLRVTPHVLCF